MRRREFIAATPALLFAACNQPPAAPAQPTVTPDGKTGANLKIYFFGALVFAPDQQNGRDINRVALVDHDRMHIGRLVLHVNHVLSGDTPPKGNIPTQDEFDMWRLPSRRPGDDLNSYRWWELSNEFTIVAPSTDLFTSQLSNGTTTIVPMKTLAGEIDLTKWRQHAKAHTVLSAGTLSLSTARESVYGHHTATWKYQDENGKTAARPSQLTDVVELNLRANEQPSFLVSEKVDTRTSDVTAWIFQVRKEQDHESERNRAKHCASYYDFAKVDVKNEDRKVPYRVTPHPGPQALDEGLRTSDPVFCPPGTYEL